MFGFVRGGNGARWSYRRGKPAVQAAVPGAERPPGVPTGPLWPTDGPTAALPQPGRAGRLTPARTWRANGDRW
ncbi:hypothetical protein ABZS77_00425 [Micromonospora sp. NPDC005298]|uniref:hypothetical protein n=1 Tax=Micromonospora sp. NPDC005298 TaxID=3156873 RepID=UPI0033A2C7AE